MQKVKAFSEFETNLVLYSKKQNIKFKATGGLIKLVDGKKEQNLVFEVIRRNDEWEDKLVEKLNLYAEFYNFFVAKDCGFEVPPQLVIVGEDNEHIGEIFKIIKKAAIPLKDEEMFFTTELKHLADTLEGSLIEFEYNKEANTYKGITVKSSLLKPGEVKKETKKPEKKSDDEYKSEDGIVE